jgi:hypothetical protein
VLDAQSASALAAVAVAVMPAVALAAPPDFADLPYPNSVCALGALNAHDAIANQTIPERNLEPLPGASEYGRVGPHSIDGCTGKPER